MTADDTSIDLNLDFDFIFFFNVIASTGRRHRMKIIMDYHGDYCAFMEKEDFLPGFSKFIAVLSSVARMRKVLEEQREAIEREEEKIQPQIMPKKGWPPDPN